METYDICLLAVALLLGLVGIIAAGIAWNRFMRHLNIRAAGWPPAYLDADGDQHTPREEP